MRMVRAILLRVAVTVGALAVAYLLLYGQPSGLEGGLILPYTTHVTGAYTIALTFDDGPDPVYTPQILEILARHRVPATFFVLGRHVEAHPELVRRIVADGHAVGSPRLLPTPSCAGSGRG